MFDAKGLLNALEESNLYKEATNLKDGLTGAANLIGSKITNFANDCLNVIVKYQDAALCAMSGYTLPQPQYTAMPLSTTAALDEMALCGIYSLIGKPKSQLINRLARNACLTLSGLFYSKMGTPNELMPPSDKLTYCLLYGVSLCAAYRFNKKV